MLTVRCIGMLLAGATFAVAACSSDSEPAAAPGGAGQAGSDAAAGGAAGAQGGGAGDAGAAGQAGSQAGSAGAPEINCQPQLAEGWTPDPYVSAVGHQDQCTPEELADYYICWQSKGQTCIEDAGHKECSACLLKAHGANPPPALMQHPGYIEINQAVCLELAVGSAACAATQDAITDCREDACDPVCPLEGKDPVFTYQEAMACRTASTQAGGVCEAYGKANTECLKTLEANVEVNQCYGGIWTDKFLITGKRVCGGASAPCAGYIPAGYKDPAYVPVSAKGKCTPEQISQFWDACSGAQADKQACADFATAAKGCYACVVVGRNSVKLGALSHFLGFAMLNAPGCVEAMGQLDCAKKLQAADECAWFACLSSCSASQADIEELTECVVSASGDPAGACGSQVAAANACSEALPEEVQSTCLPPNAEPDAGSDAGQPDAKTRFTQVATAICGP